MYSLLPQVDACFGNAKGSTKDQEITCPEQLLETFRTCTETNRITPVLPNSVKWVDWKAFLASYFNKSIPKIRGLHSFRFSAEFPGQVFLKELVSGAGEERSLNLFKEGVTAEKVRAEAERYILPDFGLPIPEAKLARVKQLEKVFKLATEVTGVEREDFFKKYL